MKTRRSRLIGVGLGAMLIALMPVRGMAQEALTMSLTMRKDIHLSNNAALYRVGFKLSGDPLINARKVIITVPDGDRMEVQNRLNLSTMDLEVTQADYKKFITTFPEGNYNMYPVPRRIPGLRNIFLSHDFPAQPALLYPPGDGAIVPLTFNVEWHPLADIANSSIFLEINGQNRRYSVTLPPSATSFTLPDGLLEPSQQYEMILGVAVQDGSGSRHETAEILNFTTTP
jgi:hypothetical protein